MQSFQTLKVATLKRNQLQSKRTAEQKKQRAFYPTIFWVGLLIIFVRIAAAAVQAKQFRPPPPSCLHVSLGGLKWRCNPCSMSWSAPCLLPGWSSPINLCLKCIQRIGLRGQPNSSASDPVVVKCACSSKMLLLHIDTVGSVWHRPTVGTR